MGQRFFKIRGRTLDEAYRIMSDQFGPDAVVVNTRMVNESGLLGLLGRKRVELTASVQENETGRRLSPVEKKYAAHTIPIKENAPQPQLKEFETIIREAQRRMKVTPSEEAPRFASSGAETVSSGGGGGAAAPMLNFPKRNPESEEPRQEIRRELQEIRELIQVLYAESPGGGLPSEFAPHYRALIHRGVSRKVAAALIGSVTRDSDLAVLRDPRVFAERLHFEVRRLLRVTGGIAVQSGARRVVALIGATGVGKTTNLAKLAAHFAVSARARVALLTMDTYRVGAPEQLRVYANIIGLPMRIANDAKEASEALKAFQDYDLVFVDTAGGSQFNLEQINELKGLLQVVRPHETALVMSATTQLEDLRNVTANFACLQPNSVTFTKLDETRQYGAMFSMLVESGLPLGYVSVGQNVPDDLRIATPAMIANLVLEGKDSRG